MEIDSRKSEIVEFYRDKNIFITGASGFLGRLLLEKLLRTCNPKKLYILVRAKKGTSPRDRLQALFSVTMLDKLKSLKPDFMDHVELIEGDISLPGLGISENAKAVLVEKIHVVFHGAATVNFEEPLKRATAINVRGSKDISLLCREMKNLQAFVHVSTAFCQCPKQEIKEMFYDAPLSADNLIRLTEFLNEDQLANISKTIMGEWPNTYVFTKAVAEDAIKNYAMGLPACVFRPAIVISTVKDPIEGWIDNIYGPSGIAAGSAAGLIRVCRADPDARIDFVPADLCINGMMASAYKTSLLGPDAEIPIFNFTTAKDNPLTVRRFHDVLYMKWHEMPVTQAVWYPTLTTVKSAFWLKIFCFLFHILPAFMTDVVLFVLQKKPQAMKIYRKVHKLFEVQSYFSTRSWNFHNNNLHALWNGLKKTDQQMFDFDMSRLDWDVTIRAFAVGIRGYIMKEDPSEIPAAKRKHFLLYLLHRAVQLIFFGLFVWLTISVIVPALRIAV